MSSAGLGGLLEGLSNGAVLGMRLRSGQDAEKEREAERKWRDEQRTRQKKEWDEEDALKSSLKTAAAPGVAESGGVAGSPLSDAEGIPMSPTPAARMNGQVYPSMAQATQAAQAHNAPPAAMARMSDAYAKHGDPVRANQLRMQTMQGEATQLQLEQAKQAQEREKFMRGVAESLKGGWKGLPQAYEKYGDGLKAEVIEDGQGGATVIQLDKDGKEVGSHKFAGLPDAFAAFVSTADPKLWIEREDKKAETGRIQANSDRDFGLRERQLNAQIAHQNGMRALAGTRTEANAAPAPLWDAKADDFLKTRYTAKDELTGATVVDGNGMEFAKVLALGAARQNGGDTTIALGRAFDIDNRLREKAGGDPKLLSQYRSQYLQAITAPPAAPAGPAAAPVSAPAPAPAATRAPLAQMSAAAAPPQLPPGLRPTGNAATDALLAQNVQAIEPLNLGIAQAEAHLAAAAKSGDARVVPQYAARLTELKAVRDEEIRRRFGNNADAYLRHISSAQR